MAQRFKHYVSIKPGKLGTRLGQLGVCCFGAGALTSSLFVLSDRFPIHFSSITQSGASPIAGIGLVSLQTEMQGVNAFPKTMSSSHLCLPTNAASVATTSTPTLANSGSSLLTPLSHSFQEAVNADMVGQLGAPPWPGIHTMARQARVPILMYHDVLETKEVFFDVTVDELKQHFERIKEAGLTPISMDQLMRHLRTGAALPPKPVLLTFDDGYEGHYTHVYPLLKEYQYPAVFSLFTGKMDGEVAGRSTVTWEQAQEMAADPLITIASHSITHPPNLTEVDDVTLEREVVESKSKLEAKLGIPIRYFTYPAGYYDDRVLVAVKAAGYEGALTMSNTKEWFAGESNSVLEIGRFGQSQLEAVLPAAWEGLALPIAAKDSFDFNSPVRVLRQLDMAEEEVPLALITGGRPATVHADSRYQLTDILARTNAIAAVDGAFFSLEYLDSNVMIGPVLSQATQTFVPGNPSENPLLNGRPLALIGPHAVKFVPFNAAQHNTLQGIQVEMPEVTDAFVGAAWLVRDGQPQSPESFGTLFDFEAFRHRAFWGINKAGQPVIGVSKGRIDSVGLGQMLYKVGFRDAIMVDSGASTSLAYQGESLVDYTPRPVPHMIALLTGDAAIGTCPLTLESQPTPDTTSVY